MDFRKIPSQILQARSTVLRYSVVAALFCIYDVLSFVNLGNFDPQTYTMMMQLRTVLTGAIWEVMFKKSLRWVQRGGLLLVTIGCMIKQLDTNANIMSSIQASPFLYGLLAVQIAANVLAGVANELLLKTKGDMSLNLQNSISYAWTLIFCLLTGVLCPVERIRLNLFDMEQWAKMLDPHVLPSLIVLTVLGLVTSVMLKILDSMWKAIATCVELFGTAYASVLFFGYTVALKDVGALCVAAFGVGLYSGVCSSPQEDNGKEKDAADQRKMQRRCAISIVTLSLIVACALSPKPASLSHVDVVLQTLSSKVSPLSSGEVPEASDVDVVLSSLSSGEVPEANATVIV